jgi:uncharacterized protein (DUF362 family)
LPKAVALVGGFQKNKSNFDKVVIKINLCDARTPDTGTITHPVFLDAALELIRQEFGEIPIYVVESDGCVVFADNYIKWFGFLPVIQKWNAKWANLSKGECITRQIPFWNNFEVQIPKIFENAYFITMPKLKTNTLTKITCCLKNQFGCNPSLDKQDFHRQIDKAIAAFNWAVGAPDFCLVDGIIGQGGIWGPSFGVPIKSEVIVAGKDEVAVDCACAKIMGFNPNRVKHIQVAAKVGLGRTHYTLAGELIGNVQQDFKWSELNAKLFMMAKRIRDREYKKMKN